MDDVAVRVGEYLHLDVTWVDDQLLDVDVRVREVRLPLPPGALERLLRLRRVVHFLHALAAAARRGLDQERVAELVAERHQLVDRADGIGRSRDDRDACLLHCGAGGRLRPHQLDRGLRRADPDESGILNGPRERRVLGEKAVARMDGLRPGALRRVEDPVDQGADARLEHADLAGREPAVHDQTHLGVLGRVHVDHRPEPLRDAVGHVARVGHVQRGPVALRVDTDRADAELAQRPEDADRDLSPIGDQNLVEHGRAVFSTPWT